MPEMAVVDESRLDLLPDQVIRALTTLDTSELDRLLPIAEDLQARRVKLESSESAMRLLSAVLSETSRNLRLLKRLHLQPVA